MPEWKRSSDRKYVDNSYGRNSEEYEKDDFQNTATFDSKRLREEYFRNSSREEVPTQSDFDFDLEKNDDYYDDYYDDERRLNIRRILIVLGIIILIVLLIVFGVKALSKKGEKEEPTNTVATEDTNSLVSSIAGFKVMGKIKIPKLNVEQFILKSTTEEALNNGVGYIDNGASINNYGNFAIAGHNVEGVFDKLSELEKGDEIILVEKNLSETKYVVTDKFTTDPNKLDCLLQDDTKVELTLVTCQKGATERLIVKAQDKSTLAATE